MRRGSTLEYGSRGRGFESYSGHFHSHKLSRLKREFQLSVIPGKRQDVSPGVVTLHQEEGTTRAILLDEVGRPL